MGEVLKRSELVQQIAELRAQMEAGIERTPEAPAKAGRKTVPASTAQFLAKQGIETLDSVEAGALDAALTGLSLEQRIAVTAQGSGRGSGKASPSLCSARRIARIASSMASAGRVLSAATRGTGRTTGPGAHPSPTARMTCRAWTCRALTSSTRRTAASSSGT